MAESKPSNSSIYLAEFLGTFVFLLCGISCVANLLLAGANLTQWGISIAWGFAVTMGVYLCAAISGAHLNPSVTVALAIYGCFDKKKILPYIGAQMLAGFLAAALSYFLYYDLFQIKLAAAAAIPDPVEALKAKTQLVGVFCTFPKPGLGMLGAFMTELVITAILMSLIMALTDDGNGIPRGPMAPLLIGIVVALIGACFGQLTGFAMNAARDFGPRLFATIAGWGTDAMTGYPLSDKIIFPYFLVPLIAPIIGACIGAKIYTVVIGKKLVCSI
ncbi:MAG: aquaporin [Deltaproteobacteria bacterium]|jgi:glycerol uptake facilitator protein|nr:aquaporin [Deltaproteobacteria bacterium]